MRSDIRSRLIEVAKAGEIIFYSELDIGIGAAAGRVLTEIAEYEYNAGRPLLVALVVSKHTGMPSSGFWNQPWIPTGLTDQQRPVFWARELIRVLDYWRSH